MKKLLHRLWLTALTALLLMSYAFAYLDPATLTYVIQIVAGIAIAGTAAIGIFWKRIRLYFKKKSQKNKAQGNASAAADDPADTPLPGVISDEELGLDQQEKNSGERGHDGM